MNLKYYRNNRIITAAFLLLTLGSCKKYLEEKSDKSLVVPHTINDLQGMLDDNVFMNKSVISGYAESSADDYYLLQADFNSIGDQGQKAYTWKQITAFDDNNDWQQAYYAIYNANYCLEQIQKVERSPINKLQWDNVMGSALFFRSYYFLNLAWTYAKAYDNVTANKDLGIALRQTSDFNVKSQRATVQSTYDKIIEDAKAAAQYLPNSPTHVMRPSKPAAYGLLARAYLSMRIYDSAFKYADLSLQIKNDLIDYNDASQVDPTSFTPFQPFNKEVIFYSTESGNYACKIPDYAKIDTLLYNYYDDNDLRKTTFFFDYSGWLFKGNYNTSNYDELFSGIATDEMYLTRAECEARLNKVSSAITDLNSLLIKRWTSGTFTPLTAVTQQQTLSIILLERRKELLMRGLRWIDIKRLNKEGANISPKRIINGQAYMLQPNSDKFALPLPYNLMQLTDMPQNPGW